MLSPEEIEAAAQVDDEKYGASIIGTMYSWNRRLIAHIQEMQKHYHAYLRPFDNSLEFLDHGQVKYTIIRHGTTLMESDELFSQYKLQQIFDHAQLKPFDQLPPKCLAEAQQDAMTTAKAYADILVNPDPDGKAQQSLELMTRSMLVLSILQLTKVEARVLQERQEAAQNVPGG